MLAIPDIRLAVPMDAGAIAAMSRDYIEHGLGWSWTAARVSHAIHEPSTNVVVARRRESMVGFGIMQYGDDTAHLALLAVDPTRRHQGLGKRLLGWLEQSARSAGMTHIRLEARADNRSAIAFYRSLEYLQAGTVPGYYEGSIDAVQLEKRLA